MGRSWFESGPRDMRANTLRARVEPPVRNRSSVSALPFVFVFLVNRALINRSLDVIGRSLHGVAE